MWPCKKTSALWIPSGFLVPGTQKEPLHEIIRAIPEGGENKIVWFAYCPNWSRQWSFCFVSSCPQQAKTDADGRLGKCHPMILCEDFHGNPPTQSWRVVGQRPQTASVSHSSHDVNVKQTTERQMRWKTEFLCSARPLRSATPQSDRSCNHCKLAVRWSIMKSDFLNLNMSGVHSFFVAKPKYCCYVNYV